ncbi:tRNA lysidine(34) synthetase TilS [Isoptericola sp. S6320L]|uniref:tRNA lysidine(34) synthetase TilS n=1 Tax=Isoptericola sp. S6320L TaxID=2926411 RepID=UPI001FF2FE72|nr:tRNA lysidine(34) synthetase TilS [Isoptericola sp. S6320L]MCK0116375.1 tRNA lysidine(34) synthetase TilS [Isoptericola sp. S6320L]
MARVDPALAAARAAVRGELADLPPDALVLVACSGGPDSSALAATLATESRRVGRSVRSRGHAVRAGAVVVDHALQPGSDGVARRAAQQCRELGLDPVVVRRVEVDPVAGGPESAARDARYAAFDDVVAATGAAAVLLGHTLDDQAEQVLLGLARGSGTRSLAGMPRRRGPYRRPFLGLRRAQTERVCAVVGLAPWQDPTNDASAAGAPLRSRVRGRLLPALEEVLGPGAVAALGRSADQLRDDADLLDALAADLLAAARVPAGPPGGPPAGTGGTGPTDAGDAVVLDVTPLAEAPAALRRRVLRAAALAAGCPAGTTTSRHVTALDALVVRWRGQREVHLPGGARATRACGRLVLRSGTVPGAEPIPHHEE